MTSRQRQQQRPPAAIPAAGGAAPPALVESSAVVSESEIEQLRADFADLREQVQEHAAVLASRIERHRRRVSHPRLYQDGSTTP